MEGKENIFDELKLISGFVADISRETPYALPEGYFESLADQVFLRIRAEDDEHLSLSMTGEPEFRILNDPEPVYSVPTGYFEGFAAKLMDRIKAGQDQDTDKPESTPLEELALLSPFLSSIGKKMPFQVPEGYFADLTASLSLITDGEENVSPLLTGLKTIPSYQAPEGYFDGLADTILGKAKQQDKKEQALPAKQPAPAKIISFGRRRTWWKVAAAAVVSGLILTGGWLKLHNSAATPPVDITKSLSNVSDQEIESYLDNQNTPLAEDLSNSTASVDITESDIKSLLGDISDGELKEYVDEHGDAKDIATN